MNWNKKTIFAALALTGIMACAQFVRAQDATTNTPAAGGKKFKKAGMTNAPMIQMLQELNLTEDQRQKVRPIFKEMREKRQTLESEGALTQEEKFSQMKEMVEGADAKLKTILTPDQYAKYEEWAKNARGMMREKAKAAGYGPVEARSKLPTNAPPATLPTN